MIFDIEDGIFDREAIEAVCTSRGYRMLKFHFTEGNDMRENKFFAWLEPIAPSSGWTMERAFALEADLRDNGDEEDDDFMLYAEIRNEIVEISVSE